MSHVDLMVMTAAVDMKPTITIIKAEKMDGEYYCNGLTDSRRRASPAFTSLLTQSRRQLSAINCAVKDMTSWSRLCASKVMVAQYRTTRTEKRMLNMPEAFQLIVMMMCEKTLFFLSHFSHTLSFFFFPSFPCTSSNLPACFTSSSSGGWKQTFSEAKVMNLHCWGLPF